MEKSTEKHLSIPKIDVKRAGTLTVGIILIVLVIALCITGGMRSHIQREYTQTRDELGEMLYTELYMLCQTFDQVTVPGAEVQDEIIPSMRERYIAAKALNDALTDGFSARYTLLGVGDVEAIDAAFAAYDAAFRTGQPTDSAQSAMQSCVDSIRALLNARYPKGVLKAA